MAKRKASTAVWLRRISQAVFLVVFFYLFYELTYHPENRTVGSTGMFFNFDPLIMLTVWLGGHAVASGLLLSLITLVVTLVFGRWFCGWVCPFGTLNHLFTSWRGSKRKDKIQEASYTPMQKAKYYIVGVVLVGSLFGANMAGWLDPFSLLYRSFATAVFPGVNAVFQGIFDWFYEVNPLGLKAVSEPVYRLMRSYFLTMGQPRYYWGMFFGVVLGAVLVLNFYKARFWCRYVCPLGGLLGVVGKNPALRLNREAEKCKDCMECVVECQGGAEPQSNETWKPAECVYCWNCESVCPTKAIRFEFKMPETRS